MWNDWGMYFPGADGEGKPRLMVPPRTGWLEPSIDEIAKITPSVAEYLRRWFDLPSPPKVEVIEPNSPVIVESMPVSEPPKVRFRKSY